MDVIPSYVKESIANPESSSHGETKVLRIQSLSVYG